jgi:hypothetical protein
MKSILRVIFCFLLITGIFTGCDESSEGYEDHVPADGMGCLVIYNRTAVELSGYLDGFFISNIQSWEYELKDYEPGTYKAVVLQTDGNKNYTADVEILEGVLTVLKMSFGDGSSKYFSVQTEYIDKK